MSFSITSVSFKTDAGPVRREHVQGDIPVNFIGIRRTIQLLRFMPQRQQITWQLKRRQPTDIHNYRGTFERYLVDAPVTTLQSMSGIRFTLHAGCVCDIDSGPLPPISVAFCHLMFGFYDEIARRPAFAGGAMTKYNEEARRFHPSPPPPPDSGDSGFIDASLLLQAPVKPSGGVLPWLW
ncbi:uncharacterized protein ARMOST_00091 [Armillaria ostoyae]|uniref:Uncharacterized protein n=1 Tax=Armillaria ostoyae TaxID=47428 RepID=A0A284QK60_ARMOS|nr:uncharacterized protein ARMOST_00091 [Armillaria ostoyae]